MLQIYIDKMSTHNLLKSPDTILYGNHSYTNTPIPNGVYKRRTSVEDSINSSNTGLYTNGKLNQDKRKHSLTPLRHGTMYRLLRLPILIMVVIFMALELTLYIFVR